MGALGGMRALTANIPTAPTNAPATAAEILPAVRVGNTLTKAPAPTAAAATITTIIKTVANTFLPPPSSPPPPPAGSVRMVTISFSNGYTLPHSL